MWPDRFAGPDNHLGPIRDQAKRSSVEKRGSIVGENVVVQVIPKEAEKGHLHRTGLYEVRGDRYLHHATFPQLPDLNRANDRCVKYHLLQVQDCHYQWR